MSRFLVVTWSVDAVEGLADSLDGPEGQRAEPAAVGMAKACPAHGSGWQGLGKYLKIINFMVRTIPGREVSMRLGKGCSILVAVGFCLQAAAMTKEEACRVFGVGPGATVAQVTKAYRPLALKWHPDKNPGRETEAGNVSRCSDRPFQS
jgi:hypothetical protein